MRLRAPTSWASRCRQTVESSITIRSARHHASAWNAKPRLRNISFSVEPSMPERSTALFSCFAAGHSRSHVRSGTLPTIGGSWKKSPHATSCTPPKAGTSQVLEPRHS